MLKKYCYDGSRKLDLKSVPTNSKSDHVDKKAILEKTAENQQKIHQLQDKLYADGREGLIIVLQARDAAGKDSTIKHVLGGINPQGVDVYSFKQPSGAELAHDFLWRFNRSIPQRGKIAIFNRSYYEDVLVVRVHKLYEKYAMPKRCIGKADEFFKKRYGHIVNYEEYLYDNGYRILKIFLNVSKDKQKERFLERIEQPEKNWKFSDSDLAERALWEKYSGAYEDAVNNTATKKAPWYVLPADQKWYTRYLVSKAILEVLTDMDPRYPEMPQGQVDRLQVCKEQLMKEDKKAEK